jgi:site-specific DNA-methyltransferase (adenine-specific)
MNYKDKFKDKDKNITLYNMDCMELLKNTEDNYYDLAIVDPPYMDNFNTDNWVATNAKQKDYKNRQQTLTNNKPNKEYFNQLIRVSKNQIIWGGNYFLLPVSRGWVFWLKNQSDNYFSDGELAWTSFDRILKCFNFMWSGMLQGDMKNKESKIHPTQKPVKLYEWILQNYAKEGDKILDTHLGSGSIAIACNRLKYELTACELDNEYFEASVKRYKEQTSQIQMF